MEYEKILELIKIMEDSSLTTFSYKEGDSEILLKKEVTAVKQVEVEIIENHYKRKKKRRGLDEIE